MNLNRGKIIGKVRATGGVVIALLLLMASFSSCIKKPMDGDESSDQSVRIVLSVNNENGNIETRANEVGSEAENRIASVKVLFYDHANQTLDMIKSMDDVTSSADPDITWNAGTLTIGGLTNTTKAYDIYVIANWVDGFDDAKFNIGSPVTNLTDAFTRITGQIVAPDDTHHFLMSGCVINHLFSANLIANVALVRQVAKFRVSLKLGSNFISEYPNAIFGTATGSNCELTLFNVPNSSYVNEPTNYFMSYEKLMEDPLSALFNYPTILITEDFTTLTTEYYVYENVSGDVQKATYLLFRMPYKLNADAPVESENYYKLYVQGSEMPFTQTRRNQIYNITATITDFGSLVSDGNEHSAVVSTTIQDWNTVEVPDQVDGEIINFLNVTNNDSGDLLTSSDEGYIVAGSGETIKITCNTNVGEWYTITRDNNGNEILGGKSIPTPFISSSLLSEQSVTIVIPQSTISTKYTIDIYHAKLASEEKGSIKTLKVTQPI